MLFSELKDTPRRIGRIEDRRLILPLAGCSLVVDADSLLHLRIEPEPSLPIMVLAAPSDISDFIEQYEASGRQSAKKVLPSGSALELERGIIDSAILILSKEGRPSDQVTIGNDQVELLGRWSRVWE